MRLPLEVFEAVRRAFPADRPVGVRVSATDWLEGVAPDSWNVESTVEFVQALKQRGCDWVDVSSGGISPQQKITLGPGYQVPLAEIVRTETGMPTIAVGLITEPRQAEAIVEAGRADVVALELLAEALAEMRAPFLVYRTREDEAVDEIDCRGALRRVEQVASS